VTWLALLVAALVLVPGATTAHHVGAFTPRDTDLTLNFKQIKASAQAGRFETALRLFEDGTVHDTMARYEKQLPPGLEDGLRAALRARDLPGAELRLSVVLAFLTQARIRDAIARLREPGAPPGRRPEEARKLLTAAWRYYNLANFVVSQQNPKASVTLRVAFEDAQTYLGGMLADPMWAAGAASAATGGASAPAAPWAVDEEKALAALGRMDRTLGDFIVEGARVAQQGSAKTFLPQR
jgi:hypothetical protein